MRLFRTGHGPIHQQDPHHRPMGRNSKLEASCGAWASHWNNRKNLHEFDGGHMDSHFLKPAELATPEDLKASPRGYGFHNKDAAQALADLLNTKDKKEGRND